MTQTSHELANFFVEASKALEELPHVKGKLNQIEEELAICHAIGHGKDSRINDLHIKQVDLELAIDRLKREKDDAELAALEAKDEASKLIASIRDVMKGAAAADAILNPTPVMPEPSAPISDIGAESNSASALESHSDTAPSGQSQPDSPGSSSADGSSEATTEHTITVGGEQHPLPDASTLDIPSSSVESHDTIKRVEAPHAELSAAAISSRPYDGEAYWFKPDSIGWREWVDGGGEAAPYVNLDHHSGR